MYHYDSCIGIFRHKHLLPNRSGNLNCSTRLEVTWNILAEQPSNLNQVNLGKAFWSSTNINPYIGRWSRLLSLSLLVHLYKQASSHREGNLWNQIIQSSDPMKTVPNMHPSKSINQFMIFNYSHFNLRNGTKDVKIVCIPSIYASKVESL